MLSWYTDSGIVINSYADNAQLHFLIGCRNNNKKNLYFLTNLFKAVPLIPAIREYKLIANARHGSVLKSYTEVLIVSNVVNTLAHITHNGFNRRHIKASSIH